MYCLSGNVLGVKGCLRVTYERSLCSSYHPLSAVRKFCRNIHILKVADQNEFCFIREAFKKCKFLKKESFSSVRNLFRVNCRSFVALIREQDTETFLDKNFQSLLGKLTKIE